MTDAQIRKIKRKPHAFRYRTHCGDCLRDFMRRYQRDYQDKIFRENNGWDRRTLERV